MKKKVIIITAASIFGLGLIIYFIGSWYDTHQVQKDIEFRQELQEKAAIVKHDLEFPKGLTRVLIQPGQCVKLQMDPLKDHTYKQSIGPERPTAKYVLANDQSKYFNSPGIEGDWHQKEAGDYLVYNTGQYPFYFWCSKTVLQLS